MLYTQRTAGIYFEKQGCWISNTRCCTAGSRLKTAAYVSKYYFSQV